MEIAMQIDQISIARAANAAHYEYLDTVRKRTEEIRLENELWQRAVEEFREGLQAVPRQRPHLRPPEGRRGARQALRLAARHHQGLRQVAHFHNLK